MKSHISMENCEHPGVEVLTVVPRHPILDISVYNFHRDGTHENMRGLYCKITQTRTHRETQKGVPVKM